jgi:hypothetical protein
MSGSGKAFGLAWDHHRHVVSQYVFPKRSISDVIAQIRFYFSVMPEDAPHLVGGGVISADR